MFVMTIARSYQLLSNSMSPSVITCIHHVTMSSAQFPHCPNMTPVTSPHYGWCHNHYSFVNYQLPLHFLRTCSIVINIMIINIIGTYHLHLWTNHPSYLSKSLSKSIQLYSHSHWINNNIKTGHALSGLNYNASLFISIQLCYTRGCCSQRI